MRLRVSSGGRDLAEVRAANNAVGSQPLVGLGQSSCVGSCDNPDVGAGRTHGEADSPGAHMVLGKCASLARTVAAEDAESVEPFRHRFRPSTSGSVAPMFVGTSLGRSGSGSSRGFLKRRGGLDGVSLRSGGVEQNGSRICRISDSTRSGSGARRMGHMTCSMPPRFEELQVERCSHEHPDGDRAGPRGRKHKCGVAKRRSGGSDPVARMTKPSCRRNHKIQNKRTIF